MVFNLIFHVCWYLLKGILAFLHWKTVRDEQNLQAEEEQAGANNDPKMRVAVKPHSDVRKLFITFAVSFTIVHQLVLAVMAPASSSSSTILAAAKINAATCVETSPNKFYCSDDKKDARKRAMKTVSYYLSNFGVRQTIEGNGEENIKMRVVTADMEQYLKRWISTYDHVESLKEKCTNKHDKCVFWTSIDECIRNPGYMEQDCMLACQICDKLLKTNKDGSSSGGSSNSEF